MIRVRLMRVEYDTDVSEDDPEYWGAFSKEFRVDEMSQVVAADWSTPGKVTVTMVVPAIGDNT